jgi:hypothetical protein
LKLIVKDVEITTTHWPVIIQYVNPLIDAARPMIKGYGGYNNVDLARMICNIDGIAERFIS